MVAGVGIAGEHVRHQVEHRGDLTLMGVDLGQIADAIAVLDLLGADIE
ncbi:MAG: hypothetical protein ACOYB7_18675 [Mycobacterium sp.]